jgi:hypothetical protein
MSKNRIILMGKFFFAGRIVLFTIIIIINMAVPYKNFVPAGFPVSQDILGPSMC